MKKKSPEPRLPQRSRFFIRMLRMKVFVLLTFFSFMQATAGVYSQAGININVKDAPVYEVVRMIADQTDYLFIINENQSLQSKRVSLNLSNAAFEQAMREALKNSGLDYRIVENYIVLRSVADQPQTSAQAMEQQDQRRSLRGTVRSRADRQPLPGVNVYIKGTTIGTATDLDGKYELRIPSDARTIVFSIVGMRTEEVSIGSADVIDVLMVEERLGLEEVIVVGYGTQSRRLVTGSVDVVKEDDIKSIPIRTITGVLQGKASGVYVQQNSGTPGGAMTVRIRGNSSIQAGNQPLYVVDGVPVTAGNYGQVGFSGQGINAITDLNPNDIESITVLKDASAAAIYGARAANGVILITTKKGSLNKTAINVSVSQGIQQLAKKLDMMNADQWNEYKGLQPNGVNTDWLDEVFRQAPTSNYEISASGGDEKTKFFLSGNVYNQTGILLGTDYSRLSGRMNLDHKVNNKLTLGSNLSLTYALNNRVEGDQSLNGPLPNAISLLPINRVYNDNGTYNEDGAFANPVAIAKEAINETHSYRTLGNIFADYTLTSNLTFSTKWSIDLLNLREHSYDPITTRQGKRSNGIGIFASNNVLNTISNNTLKYTQTFAERHNIDALAGYSFEKLTVRSAFIRGTDFPNEKFRYIASAATITNASASASDRGLNSWFGRVNYNYSYKYLASFTARYDGSSKFGANHRYGFFPAASLSWRITQEDFMKQFSNINELKLRTSYGLTGNDGIPDFRNLALFGGGYNYNGQPGIAPVQLENPDLRWETTAQFNLGLDVSVYDERVNLSVDYYNNQTRDLLLSRPVSFTSGFGSITTNIGQLENKGFEFVLNTDNIRGPFEWSSALNMTFNRNKIKKLYKGTPLDNLGRGSNRFEEGQPAGIFYGYRSLGVDPTTGDIVFDDVNKDGQITAADRVKIGDPNPDFIGGFNNDLRWKNFDLNIFFQFSYGNDIFNGTRIYIESMKGSDNQSTAVLRRWKKPGDITDIPRATEEDPNNNNRISSRFIEDGSYLRLKNLTLGYNFTKDQLKRLKLNNLRLYASAYNLLTFTNYSGMDPEVHYSGDDDLRMGTDFFTYPQARSFTFGINVGF
ncbi:MAG TPA: TonB-dependent receptor [Bacteroidales bacterium]|nr:TonB-dependent receptor [Bacteroidales bacterium]